MEGGTPHVLFVCGSLRARSLNRQAGERARELLAGRAETRWLDYADVPYMNQDAEFPAPDAVRRVRDEVMAADAVWVFSPEYNHGIPGVLKNLIDWLSRPLEPGVAETALRGMPVAVTCAAGGSRGRYCAADLAEVLATARAELVDTARALVALDRRAYTTDELALAPAEQAALAAQADVLMARLGSA